ncbi:MAG: ATP-dependent Clp protease ATP-binding subunit [Spirochaetaceae bacterium]|nr:ATP-dependent Clp protease ATP-binding subunit [Spirochaetaceae bacterium]
MVKGLNQRVRRILTADTQEAGRRSNADQISPELVVIALLKDGAGTACKALMFLRIDLAEFRRTLENGLPRGGGTIVYGDIPLSKRTEKMLALADDEARCMGNEYIGTEHLLLAAMREQNSLVQVYLDGRAVDPDMLRVVVQTTFFYTANLESEEAYVPSEGYQAYLPRPGDPRDSKAPRATVRVKPSPAYPVLTPVLDEFSRDLTALAGAGKLDPVVGRQKEIDRAVRILARRTKNNPILVGEPGVGKTAIVEGLAQLFAGDKAPESLARKRILSLDLGSVVAGTKYRGEFEDRIKKMMKEIAQAGNVILFIDEIHTIIGAGGAEGTVDAANMFKPSLSRGEIQCIGATTAAEYRKYFEKDAALDRRFQPIHVDEPGLEETIAILKGLQKYYEDHHRVSYTPEAVESAAKLARRYIPDRFMPDKAIDVLDEAGAMRKLEFGVLPPEISSIEVEILHLLQEKGAMVSSQDYERAARLRDKVRNLRGRLDAVRLSWERVAGYERALVDEEGIRRVVAETTGIPLTHLKEQESKRLLKIEEELHKAVIGQDDAVRRIASAIRRSRAGIASPQRPQGSFIFLGPTGVGKTLLAKRLAAYLFGAEDALVRIDMSDYMEKHTASRLIGAPPGYIGYDEGGILTERIRRNPYRVILFDEIEKAHRDVFNLLLQVLEEGELRDNLGHTVSFRNTVIIMTSNAGVREISRDSRLGFAAGSGLMNQTEIEAQALSELRRLFNPEFINRVDETVVFHPLDMAQIEAVLDILLGELAERLAELGYALEVTPPAKRLLAEKGWDPKYGGRPLRRTLQKELEDPLSLLILEECPKGSVFIADVKDAKIRLQPKLPAEEKEKKGENEPKNHLAHTH